jgi:diguanylate cyclase (GGDEF)-like protein/PAS domain S-box-containing protein
MNAESFVIKPEISRTSIHALPAFFISFFICLFALFFDQLFIGDDSRLGEFLPYLTLAYGVAFSLTYCFGLVGVAAAFFAPIAHYFISQLFIDTSISIGELIPFAVSLSLQSYVLRKSIQLSTTSGNPLANNKNLIIYITQSFIISALISALLVASIQLGKPVGYLDFKVIALLWIANLTSLATIPPVIFAIKNHARRVKQNTHPIEWFVWLSVSLLSLYFAATQNKHYILIIIPILMWASTRFNQLACTVATFIASIVTLHMINIGVLGEHTSLPAYVFSITSLIVILATQYFSTLRSDHVKIEARLEEIVQQRTQDLLAANQELLDEVFIRKQAEKNLQNTSSRFKALFETAGIPIIVLDRKFRIKQWNASAEVQFACTKDQVLGRNFVEMFVPESIQDETAWKFTKVLESGLSKENMECEIVSGNALSHTMLWNMNSLNAYDPENKHNQLLLIGQNISNIRKTQDQLHYLAHYDALTDTANRRLFEDRCAQAIQSAIRHKSEIALIGLDIDHFKRINDTLGHDIGDQFLMALAKRLKQSVRKEDTIARLGGDEFAILLANVSGREGAKVVARNILDNITQPVNIGGNELIVTSSIGITVCPNDGTQYPDLLKNADMAMYRAKKAGRNNIQFYSPEMNREMQRQLLIEHELRTAISANQFKLYYQPIIDIETGEILALEALLRWHHPDQGIVTPKYFIDVAEQTGLLHDIGQWVITNACLQGRVINEWSKSPVQIALNLSNRQFNHPRIVELIKSTVQSTKFNPRNLILEMSESTITSNMETSFSTLAQLQALGISLTIDSFGTGLSSLRQLKQIPADIIKIDRTFVGGIPKDESDMAITETLLAIASQMDLKTFATGIETKDQEAFLKINGCRYGQGYLYSPPLPFRALCEMFENINSGESLGRGDQIVLPLMPDPKPKS